MTRRAPPLVALQGSPDEIEARFYEALRAGDLDRLMAVWADDDEIVCIHPGGARVIGAGAIRASFRAILSRGGVEVHVEQLHRLQHAGSALHHLVERIEVVGEQGPQTAWILATNFFVETAQGWRLVSHHASPAMTEEPATVPMPIDPPSTLH